MKPVMEEAEEERHQGRDGECTGRDQQGIRSDCVGVKRYCRGEGEEVGSDKGGKGRQLDDGIVYIVSLSVMRLEK